MRDRNDTAALKDMANAAALTVLARLGVRERMRGNYILMRNPRRKDTKPSLVIWLKGGTLSFRDMADSSVKGDVFDLVAYLNGWFEGPYRGMPEAVRWLKDVLGVSTMTEDQRRADASRARAARVDAEKEQAKDLERQRRSAFGMFTHAAPGLLGTPVEKYLREARGIDLAAAPFIGPRGGSLVPHALRYMADAKHIDAKGRETHWPCMIAACVDASMRIVAVHRTFLARDGSGKAPVTPARKCWPDYSGCVIPLWRGDGQFPVAEAAANGLLQTFALTEGVEDGLSAVIGAPQHRVWAVIALSNLANVARRLPPICDGVLVHRQNDWTKLQAVDTFDRALAALDATGLPVAEVAAPFGKDLNDTLMGAA